MAKGKIVILSLLFVVTLVPLVSWLYQRHEEKYFSCVINADIIRGRDQLEARLHFDFVGNKGTAEASGEFTIDGKKMPISRRLAFTYTRSGDQYSLVSTTAAENPLAALIKHPLVPDFFLMSHRGYSMEMHKQGPDAYVVVNEDLPLFYCSKK